MELALFKPLWGHNGSLDTAIHQALAEGFSGIEGRAPADPREREVFRAALDGAGLAFIAEICTAGEYVPDRTATVHDHLRDLAGKLDNAAAIAPMLVNCIGGCDAWSVADSVAFFDGASRMAEDRRLRICFETHRGRSLFNPWRTREILAQIPLELTCDFSHWSVVCEGLGPSEDGLMREVAASAGHIHGRIGYDQGPQVPDPESPRYEFFVRQHQRWWQWIWQSQRDRGFAVTTLTPEFGPDGYQQVDPRDDRPVGDLWQLNCWLGRTGRRHFDDFIQQQPQTGDLL